MDESRNMEWYKTGCMIESHRYSINDIHPAVGRLTEDKCPQCGACTFLNSLGNQWCWNCDWKEDLWTQIEGPR